MQAVLQVKVSVHFNLEHQHTTTITGSSPCAKFLTSVVPPQNDETWLLFNYKSSKIHFKAMLWAYTEITISFGSPLTVCGLHKLSEQKSAPGEIISMHNARYPDITESRLKHVIHPGTHVKSCLRTKKIYSVLCCCSKSGRRKCNQGS